jgi:site-specific DNA recombinase
MEPADHAGDIVRLTVEAHLQRVGREIKLVVHDAEHRAEADPGLLRIIARAHDFRERGIRNPDLTVTAIAGQERLTIGYLSRLLRALSQPPLKMLTPKCRPRDCRVRAPPNTTQNRLCC